MGLSCLAVSRCAGWCEATIVSILIPPGCRGDVPSLRPHCGTPASSNKNHMQGVTCSEPPERPPESFSHYIKFIFVVLCGYFSRMYICAPSMGSVL